MAIEVDRSRPIQTPPPNRPINDFNRPVQPRAGQSLPSVTPADTTASAPPTMPVAPTQPTTLAPAAMHQSVRRQPLRPVAARQDSEPINQLRPSEALTSLQPATSAANGVSIQIQVPSLDLSRQREQLRRLAAQAKRLPVPHLSRRQVIAGTLTVAVVAAAAVGTSALLHQRQQAKIAPLATGKTVAAVAAKPTFTPVVPASKPQLGTLGRQSAFDGNRDVYSYIDTLDKQQITVSEQLYGNKFSSAAAAASTIGKQLGPTTAVKTPWGDGFVATNTKYNSQTLVAPVKNLLVFIQSSQTHTPDSWQTYLSALK